jgi:hypothetical protein
MKDTTYHKMEITPLAFCQMSTNYFDNRGNLKKQWRDDLELMDYVISTMKTFNLKELGYEKVYSTWLKSRREYSLNQLGI